MRVSVELPDPPRLEPLLTGLSQQYQAVLHQLLQLQQEDRVTPILQVVQAQTDRLLEAFQQMVQSVQQRRPSADTNDALLRAIQGLRKSVNALPEDLKVVLDKQWKGRQQALTKAEAPPVRETPAASNRIVQKLDAMERALVQATRRSRSRTFGSNY